jgi:hypothetical protein
LREYAYVLDRGGKLYVFYGPGAQIRQKEEARQVVEQIKNDEHGGHVEIVQHDDSKISEFWDFLGGYVEVSHDNLSKPTIQPPFPA